MTREIDDLTGAVVRSQERVTIRTRESNHTLSAWRMEVELASGSGAITFIDGVSYRGEGLFLGWPQERLAAVYQGLTERNDEPPFEVLQLG